MSHRVMMGEEKIAENLTLEKTFHRLQHTARNRTESLCIHDTFLRTEINEQEKNHYRFEKKSQIGFYRKRTRLQQISYHQGFKKK